jgi:hypothetical protein
MAAATRTRRAATKPPVEAEIEDTEDEFEEIEGDDDLEELEEEVEEPETKPKAKRSTAKATAAKADSAPKFGSAELAAYITEKTAESYDARGIRMLLRKLASSGKLARVVGETRDRYSFSGPEDATVQAVLAMVKSGEAKALKQEGLQKVKDAAAAKKAAAAKAKAEAVEAEDDEDDMEEVEEEPKPRTRRAAAKPAAPAKATPVKATRRAAAK